MDDAANAVLREQCTGLRAGCVVRRVVESADDAGRRSIRGFALTLGLLFAGVASGETDGCRGESAAHKRADHRAHSKRETVPGWQAAERGRRVAGARRT